MDLVSETEELTLVSQDSFKDMIEYKWSTYGRKHHLLGFFMHLYYVAVFTYFVIKAYLKGTFNNLSFILMCTGIVYPSVYEWAQVNG